MGKLGFEINSPNNARFAYDFSNPQTYNDNSIEAALISALSNTAAFRRLTDVRFLGALDYSLFSNPNGKKFNSRYTRAQHSFGVAVLARAYLKERENESRDRLLCIAAAMLHDIGHPPFSHSIEALLKKQFGMNHHTASKNIILGKAELGREIQSILRDFGLNPFDVIDVLDGDDEKFDFFFSSPINFDTIEGILRTKEYRHHQNLGLTPTRVLFASLNRDISSSKETVDNFWQAKHEAYNSLIRTPAGILCDLIFEKAAEKSIHLLVPNDYYSTETYMFKKIPSLRDVLDRSTSLEFIRSFLPSKIDVIRRSFYVDHSKCFEIGQDNQRYLQNKYKKELTIDDMLPL